MQIQINNKELANRRGIPEGLKDLLAFSLKYATEMAANSNTPAARIIASGLLSAYNGYRFQFDVSSLIGLDDFSLEHLINVFRLSHYGTEPQHLILNGSTVYEMIAEKWGFEN